MVRHLYFEDTGTGAEFWSLVNEYLFDSSFILVSKSGISGVRKAVELLEDNENEHYVIVDYILDNNDVMAEIKKIDDAVALNKAKVKVIKIQSIEQLLLSFSSLCDWVQCSDEWKEIVRQFNSAYGIDLYVELDLVKHTELLKFKIGHVTGSSEKLAKRILYEVSNGTGFRDVKDKRPEGSKWILGYCWKCDCCGADKGNFNVLMRFREQCKLNLLANEKFIELYNKSDLGVVCNILRGNCI